MRQWHCRVVIVLVLFLVLDSLGFEDEEEDENEEGNEDESEECRSFYALVECRAPIRFRRRRARQKG